LSTKSTKREASPFPEETAPKKERYTMKKSTKREASPFPYFGMFSYVFFNIILSGGFLLFLTGTIAVECSKYLLKIAGVKFNTDVYQLIATNIFALLLFMLIIWIVKKRSPLSFEFYVFALLESIGNLLRFYFLLLVVLVSGILVGSVLLGKLAI
jgi:hypothetical protein